MLYITQNPQPMSFEAFADNLRDLNHSGEKSGLHQQNHPEEVFNPDLANG